MLKNTTNFFLLFLLFLLLLGPSERIFGEGQDWLLEWAHEGSRLPADKRVIWGRLPNGLRYALLRHPGIPGRVSMKIAVLAGSIEETENERGVAHFIEHMAYNGTRHFKAGELASFFQKLGMEYGHDINARTSFDNTVYSLELWENNDALLRKGLLLLRDIADGILFQSSEIDKERNVILSELRGRDGLAYRAELSSFQLFFKGLTFPNRMAIGTQESIKRLRRAQFLDFYHKWYRPDLMVIAMVGDLEPSKMVAMIKEYCGDLKPASSPLPKRNIGRFQRPRSLQASLFQISNVGSATIRAASVIPSRKRVDSVEGRRFAFNRNFAMAMLEERIGETVPIASNPSAGYTRFFGNDAVIASLNVAGNQWRDGVQSLDRVIRYTVKEGFPEKDVARQRDRELFKAQKMRAFYPKLDSGTICESLVNSITEDKVFVGLEQEFKWQEQFLRELNARTVHRTFQDAWEPALMAFHISGQVDIEKGAGEIKDAVLKGRKDRAEVYAHQFQAPVQFEPREWGKPGVVVETKTIPEFQAHLIRFDNNVRLNFIESQNEPGVVKALVRVGGGLFDAKEIKPGLREFALQAFLGSGTNRYEVSQIKSIINASRLNFSFDLADQDAFSFRGMFGSEDLDFFLGLVTEFLFHPEIYRFSYENAIMGAALNRFASGMGMQNGYRSLQNFLFRGDGRFAWGSLNDYSVISVGDVRKWIQEPLDSGYVEVSIVGDATFERVVDSASRTLGELGKRRLEKKNPSPPHAVEISAPPGYRQLEFVGEEHQAMAVGFWPVKQPLSVHDRLALQVLGGIIQRRLWEKMRESLGVSYSPTAEFSSYPEYPQFATLEASLDCDPAHAPGIARTVLEISDDIAQNGVSQSEIEEAAGPIRIKIVRAFRSNDFLLNSVLKRAQERPESIRNAIELKHTDILASVTKDQIDAFAKTLLTPQNSRAAAIIPKPFIGLFKTGKNIPHF